MQRTLRFWTSSPSGDQATARTAWWIPRIPEFPKFLLFFISKIFYIFPVPLLGDGLDGLDLVILSVLVPLNGLYAPLRCSSAFDLKESMLIELKHMFLGQGANHHNLDISKSNLSTGDNSQWWLWSVTRSAGLAAPLPWKSRSFNSQMRTIPSLPPVLAMSKGRFQNSNSCELKF